MMNRVSHWIGTALTLCAVPLVMAACGGGGSGSSDPPSDRSDQVVASLASLDSTALDGQLTDEQFVTQLDQIVASVEAEPAGPQNLASYLETQVAGGGFDFNPAARIVPRTSKTIGEAVDDIKATTTYQMLEAFVSSVASNLLLTDPAAMLLDLAQPEVFTALASVQVRTHIYDAAFSGQIDAPTTAALADGIRTNPFDAQRNLLLATNQTVPQWLEPMSDTCLRNCGPADGTIGGGGTGVYEGPFSGTMNETGVGCVWQHTLSGTVTAVVTGNGTLADPYEGSFDVSGTIVTSLLSGSFCDAGGSAEITDFSGTISGDTGKLQAEGQGTIGTGSFLTTVSNATVSSSTITGAFLFDFGIDNPISKAITLTKQ